MKLFNQSCFIRLSCKFWKKKTEQMQSYSLEVGSVLVDGSKHFFFTYLIRITQYKMTKY